MLPLPGCLDGRNITVSCTRSQDIQGETSVSCTRSQDIQGETSQPRTHACTHTCTHAHTHWTYSNSLSLPYAFILPCY